MKNFTHNDTIYNHIINFMNFEVHSAEGIIIYKLRTDVGLFT